MLIASSKVEQCKINAASPSTGSVKMPVEGEQKHLEQCDFESQRAQRPIYSISKMTQMARVSADLYMCIEKRR